MIITSIAVSLYLCLLLVFIAYRPDDRISIKYTAFPAFLINNEDIEIYSNDKNLYVYSIFIKNSKKKNILNYEGLKVIKITTENSVSFKSIISSNPSYIKNNILLKDKEVSIYVAELQEHDFIRIDFLYLSDFKNHHQKDKNTIFFDPPRLCFNDEIINKEIAVNQFRIGKITESSFFGKILRSFFIIFMNSTILLVIYGIINQLSDILYTNVSFDIKEVVYNFMESIFILVTAAFLLMFFGYTKHENENNLVNEIKDYYGIPNAVNIIAYVIM